MCVCVGGCWGKGPGVGVCRGGVGWEAHEVMDDGRAVGVDQVGLLSQFWSGKVQLFLQGGGDLCAQCASQPIRR